MIVGHMTAFDWGGFLAVAGIFAGLVLAGVLHDSEACMPESNSDSDRADSGSEIGGGDEG